MNILLSRILTYLNGTLMFDEYYKFCLYIVYKYTELEDVTMEQIVTEANIGEESILAFCKLLGFDSFDEFITVLLQNNLMRLDQIRARMLGINSQQIIDELDKDCSNEEMEAQVAIVCDTIYKAKRVVLIGAMYPMSIAVEFQTDLITFGKPVIQYHNFDTEIQLNENDFVIFISATGRSMNDFVKIKQELHIEKATSLLITQNRTYTLPEHKVATYAICVPGRFDGINFNYQIMNIFDLLRVQYYQQHYL